MSDDNNNKSSFGLNNLSEGIKQRTSELSEDAEPKTLQGSIAEDSRRAPFSFDQPDYDRTEAPRDDMRRYWRQFETTPIIRKPITSFASRVTESGYYIESRQLEEDEVQMLGDWLDTCSIIEGQPGRDFRLLARKAITQREVRGTALVEVAPDKNDDDQIAGLKLINPETMEAVTRPTQSILMAPDDIDEYEDAPEAESGDAAAWLQDISDTEELSWGQALRDDADDDNKIGFRRDEIIPLTRDADVGEVFGTSRIEAVADRVEGIKQKLDDNDQAIASKAYPLWLFLFGTEDEPWDSDDIGEFMNAHEMENFHPGMKQGVRGDVEVETISGEVADIAEYLQFDLRWIMSSMPMPMFVLGSFEGKSVGQVSGVAQQQDVNRQIKEARRELEEEFTPLIREVAQQRGIEEERAKDIKLKFGEPGGNDLAVKENQQTIRYISDAQGGKTQTSEDRQQQQQQQQQQGDDADQKQQDGVTTKGETPQSIDNPTPDQEIAGVDNDGNPYVDVRTGAEQNSDDGLWDIDPRHYEELEHGDGNTDNDMSDLVAEVFLKARNEALDKAERKYERRPQRAAETFSRAADASLNRAVRKTNFHSKVREPLREAISDVAEQYDPVDAVNQRANVRFFADSVENAARDAAEEMLRRARVIIRKGAASGEDWSHVRERVLNQYDESALRSRARLVAHMETKSAIESVKLQTFEADDSVIGVRVSNESQSTELTETLDGTEAYFSDETEIDNQIAEAVDDEQLADSFDPLPRVPPYHFNDTTTLEPIYEDE